MDIVIITENESIKIQKEIIDLQNSIKYPRDTLKIITSPAIASSHNYNVSISVFHTTNSIEAFFNVKITTEIKTISDTEYLTTNANLHSTLTEIIYLIYNYRKLTISELFTNNTYVIYYFQKYLIDELKDVKIVSTDERKIKVITDTHIRCFVDSNLAELLDKNNLVLKNKNSTFKLIKYESEYIIDASEAVIECDLINYLNETNLKISFKQFISTFGFNTAPLEEAINNINFEESINHRYNEWIESLKHKTFAIDDIGRICCKIRHYDDHRQSYYKKLLSVYEQALSKSNKVAKYKKNKTGTAQPKTIKIVDNTPSGTLKDLYHSQNQSKLEDV